MSSPICTNSPSIAQSSTAPKTRTRAAQKNLRNLQDRWGALIIPRTSSSEKTDSHRADSIKTTTEVATRVLEKEKPIKPLRKWTQDENKRLRELLDENKTPENILPILESEFCITLTKSALAWQILMLKKPAKPPIKKHHTWTDEQKERLWSLSKEFKSRKTIQHMFNLEYGLTLSVLAINTQLVMARKFKDISIKPHHIWTVEQINRLWSLSMEGNPIKKIQRTLEREFKETFTARVINYRLTILKGSKATPRTTLTPYKKWSQDDLKILKDFLQKNSLAFQKGSVKKTHQSSKNIFRGVNPKEWRKLATTLNRTVHVCLSAAYYHHSQALARSLDSSERDPEELSEGKAVEDEAFDVKATLDYLDKLGDACTADLGIVDRLEPSLR